MREDEDIIAEIHTLLDQQLQALHGKLPDREALEYIRRSRRVDELLDRLVARDAWAEVT